MLNLITTIAGRPWAIRSDLALHVRGLLTREGIAGLRHLAEIKAAAHATDDHAVSAARGGRVASGGGGLVAVVPVVGTMTQRGDIIGSAETRSTASVAAEVLAAAADSQVDAIVLEIDSGGGEVYGVPEAWSAIRAAGKLKPVVAVANSQAASAALYLASAAREFWITPSGEAGSLGVYALHVDASKAIEDQGEKWTFVAADDSPYKVEGNPSEPLSADAAEQIRKSVNRYMAMFVRDVARGRGVSEKAVLAKFGGGRMLGPDEAVSVRMADRVGTLEHAVRRAAELAREPRSVAGPGRASTMSTAAAQEPLLRVQAGISEAPELGAGTPERSCASCEYFSQPTMDHDGGSCSRHGFHTMKTWVCADHEAKAGDEEQEPAEPEPMPMPMDGERAAAASKLRLL